jgi:hypothetical protein
MPADDLLEFLLSSVGISDGKVAGNEVRHKLEQG